MTEWDVSIPFKRESGDKVEYHPDNDAKVYMVSIPFKRESGDKASNPAHPYVISAVSIPFKRESGDKVITDHIIEVGVEKFQFPSNGKVETKLSVDLKTLSKEDLVSIPFKRESGDKGN